jgi:hypothetical protein
MPIGKKIAYVLRSWNKGPLGWIPGTCTKLYPKPMPLSKPFKVDKGCWWARLNWQLINKGFIDLPQLKALALTYKEAEYGKYLKRWIDEQ